MGNFIYSIIIILPITGQTHALIYIQLVQDFVQAVNFPVDYVLSVGMFSGCLLRSSEAGWPGLMPA